MTKREASESVYQDIAGLIDRHSYCYKIVDDKYPRLIIKTDSINNQDERIEEEYEIIIKKVKRD
jgi:hypothetical protein